MMQNIFIRNPLIFSALSEASAGGDPETVLFFIKNGANVNSIGQFHRTPLYRTSFGGHIEAAKVRIG